MKLLEEINNLPDYMKPEELTNWFFKVIDNFKDGKINKIDALKCFVSLSERQWHTYELIGSELKTTIENWILQYWENDIGFIDEISIVTGTLGLEIIYDKIKALMHQTDDAKLKELIEEIVKEFGDSVSDPYSSLR
jgi:hypothetical protein